MEKGKNRGDLLAAGRKKLQQFRQKKDPKGSSSSSQQVKSSNKAGKPGKSISGDVAHPPDQLSDAEPTRAAIVLSSTDADGSSNDPAVLPVAAILATLAEGGAESAVDAELVPGELPPSASATQHDGGVRREQDSAEDISSVCQVDGDMRLMPAADQDANCSRDQCNGSIEGVFERTQHGDSLNAGVLQLDDGKCEADESISRVDSEAGEDTSTLLHLRTEGGEEIDEFPTSAEKTHEEGDLSTVSGSSESGFLRLASEKDGRPFAPLDGEATAALSGDDFPMASSDNYEREGSPAASSISFRSEASTTENARDEQSSLIADYTTNHHRTMKADDNYVSPVNVEVQVTDKFHLPTHASPKVETDCSGSQEFGDHFHGRPGIMYQVQDVVATESENGAVLTTTEREDTVYDKKDNFQGVVISAETESGVELPEGRLVSVDEDLHRHLEERDSGQLQLSEPISTKGLLNIQSTLFSGDCFAEEVENLKQHLYVTNLNKDFLHLQLDEQIEDKAEFDLLFSDQVSGLQKLVTETEENSARVHKELADCRSELQAMTSQNEDLEENLVYARGEIEVLNARVCTLQSKLEFCQEESSSLMAELSDCRDSLAVLQLENSNLNAHIVSEKEERKKLNDKREYLAHENMRLASELLLQKEQLVVALSKQAQFEGDLKDSLAFLEKLTEENLSLSISLAMHEFKLKDLEDLHLSYSKAGESVGLVENLLRDSAIEAAEVSGKNLDQDSPLFMLEDSVSISCEQGESLQQVENEDVGNNSALCVLKRHLKEAAKIVQKIEKTIQGMHSHSMSLSRPGSRLASSGVSKLIQAFETKSTLDETMSNQSPPVEVEKSADSLAFAKEQTQDLRDTLEQMEIDVERAMVLFDAEKESRMCAKELEVECEFQKLRSNNLEKEIGGVIENLSGYKLVIDGLQSQLDDFSRNAADEAGRFLLQVDTLQKEVDESSSALEREQNLIRDAFSEAINKLDVSTGFSPSVNSNLASHIIASTDAAMKLVQGLNEKLEVVCKDRDAVSTTYEELHKDFMGLKGSKEFAIRILTMIHSSLRELTNGSFENEVKEDSNSRAEELLETIQEDCETLIEQLKKLLGERALLLSGKNELEAELLNRSQGMEELKQRCILLDKNMEDLHHVKDELERLLMNSREDFEGLSNRCLALAKKLDDHKMAGSTVNKDLEVDSVNALVSHLEASVASLLHKYDEIVKEISLSKNFLREVEFFSEISDDHWSTPMHILLRQDIVPKVMESSELQDEVCSLRSSNIQQENEMQILKESLAKMEEALKAGHSELQGNLVELEQSEQRLSSVREKLSIAVAKGKGLVVQRDSLKQSLVKKSSELEKCLQELQSKETMLREVEAKLKSYSEADRVEALESELSYIRNSATAFRDSFLLKDSILQRIEEILEDLDLPEHFHSKDTIEKIELLARSVAGNSSFLSTDWDQKSSVGGSHSDAGYGGMDTWKEDLQPTSSMELYDFKRKFEELQSKFYGLAEHNDMLEQSLVERNTLVQRWEEILDGIDMPPYLRSMEPEVRIEWLKKTLFEVQHERDSLLVKIENLGESNDSLLANLEESQEKISDLESAFIAIKHEREFLSECLENLRRENLEYSETEVQGEEKVHLQKDTANLQDNLAEAHNLENKEYHDTSSEIQRLRDLVGNALLNQDKMDMYSGDNHIECLEGILGELIDKYKALCLEKSILTSSQERTIDEDKMMLEEQKMKDMLEEKEQSVMALKAQVSEISQSLALLKEERDTISEKNHSLILEMAEVSKQRGALLEEREAMMEKYQSLLSEAATTSKQRESLLEQLSQEEQRSASAREKLNVAIRKGKGLVQQRDSLKQTIDEMNVKVERLQNDLNQRESENVLLRNKLAETEYSLQDIGRVMSSLLAALHAIDVDMELNVSDPVQKLEAIGKLISDWRASAVCSEQEVKKSKRAAELLVAELNEVQERADNLQEELSKAEFALKKCFKQRDEIEAARVEALSQLAKTRAVHSEERKKQLGDVILLKADIGELRNNCFSFSSLLSNIFFKDVNLYHSLETSMASILKQIDGSIAADQIILDSSSLSSNSMSAKERSLSENTSLETKIPEHFDGSLIMEHLKIAGYNINECVEELDDLKEKVEEHSVTVEQEAKRLATLMVTIEGEIASKKASSESLKKDITRLEMVKIQKETEVNLMQRNLVLLYEACSSSLLEIENRKSQRDWKGLGSAVQLSERMDVINKLLSCDEDVADEHSFSLIEDNIKILADALLSSVKGLDCMQEEIVEGNERELKLTISDLQQELQEKDVQRNKICTELLSQIREAEAVAKKYAVDLESAKNELLSLENQVRAVENDKKLLELKVDELEGYEVTSKNLREKITNLTDSITAKDHEIEGLMQALDEEESQMENLEITNQELEKLLQEKTLAFDTLEASRAKAMAKLSTTVNKFDELHHLSENLLAEVENLQLQLQERDSEISFLRQEVTRCTNDVLTEQESNKKNSTEMHQLQTWMTMMISRFGVQDMLVDSQKCSQVQGYMELLEKKVSSLVVELDDLRITAQNKDALLEIERGKVKELFQEKEILIHSLHEKGLQMKVFQQTRDSGKPSTTNSVEPLEIEPVRNKGGTLSSIVPHVRSGRKVNSDQIAIGIDLEQDNVIEDEDDDKAHGFTSLTMSRVVPKATRPVADRIDGLWVSIERLLMRQPTLRLGLIIYWVALHALLAASI